MRESIGKWRRWWRTGKLVREHYSGRSVANYEQRRQQNPKWLFEKKSVEAQIVAMGDFCRKRGEMITAMDAPCGTGRFTHFLAERSEVKKIILVDLSSDMLAAAQAASMQRVGLFRRNILTDELPGSDLTLSVRFLNLLGESDWRLALASLLKATRRSLIGSIRLTEDVSPYPILAGKSTVLARGSFANLLSESGFSLVSEARFTGDNNPGSYIVFRADRDGAGLNSAGIV